MEMIKEEEEEEGERRRAKQALFLTLFRPIKWVKNFVKRGFGIFRSSVLKNFLSFDKNFAQFWQNFSVFLKFC